MTVPAASSAHPAPVLPNTRKAPLLARDDLPRGEQDHDHGGESSPERRHRGKQQRQHVSEEDELSHHAHNRNG